MLKENYNHSVDCKEHKIRRGYAYDDDRDIYHKAKAYVCDNCGHITYKEG